ncbi:MULTISPECIES: class I adenylate-forming enzyme family protein [unclassified Streptomyces]|uniref:class I adenylate-forming enzyme family protein n=1 Tax=unclassified Streptomyces TaxID=2593676 RepID=UPI0006F80E26|nr:MULTISPECIES: class I adenylate-forming enzyme family protein [unclassified Streptomyces]KQX57950.1 acyl-CoA synthetase [Streptomyces sp. Root1304]KRA78834.1 acyl-CoA synthetase [Streptomyces sp. Root66D1]
MADARPTEPGGEAPEARLTAPGAPFAVSEGVYASGPRTLREFVEATWAYGDRVFLVSEDGATTYREFFDAACGLARRLAGEYGLRPGDRAVVAMRNLPEWQTAFWAAQLAGLVAVPLNAWWTEDEFAYALDDCAPGVLLVDGERVARVRAWARERKVPGIVFRGEAEDGFLAYVPDTDPFLGPPDVDVLPEQDATVIYTSGTTGRPKGAVATHLAQAGAAMNPRYFAAAAALARGDVPGTGPAPVSLTTFPFFHVAAFTSFYAVMAAGGTLVMMRKWDADRALELIRAHGVTHYAGVPTTALQLLEAARAAGDDLATLTLLSTGGAAAPPGIVAGITEGYGERVEPRNGYGLTETCGGVLSNVGAEYRAHPGSVGRPTPTTEVRIEAPDAEGVGELWLRGQALVRGYWGNEEATRAAFSEDGWFRTGDLARVDADGRVTVVDRLTDMVIRGGENVYCVEVEGVLQGHPDVLDAAVLGVPHPLLGEEVAAVVRLRPGATTDAEDLRTYVGGRLAAFKVPARVVVREEELPRNPTGKLLKRELRGSEGLADGG